VGFPWQTVGHNQMATIKETIHPPAALGPLGRPAAPRSALSAAELRVSAAPAAALHRRLPGCRDCVGPNYNG